MRLIKKMYKNRISYGFVLPALFLILLFKYQPFIEAIVKSLYNWNGANVNTFIGLENYKRLFSDAVFGVAIKNVVLYTIFTVAVSVTIPFVTAALVVAIKKTRVQNFFKLGFVVPMVVPSMVTILLWKWILAGDNGILNELLRTIGLSEWCKPWLSNPNTALVSIAFVNFPWISGLPFLLFLSGLQSIPDEIYESAEVDGITPLKKLIYIQMPMIRSQFKLVSMYTLIQAFQIFEGPKVLTNGGPGRATITPALYLYQRAFDYNEFGYASTVGVVLMIIILIFTMVNKALIKDNENY